MFKLTPRDLIYLIMIFLKTCKSSYDENDVPEETFLGLGSQRDEDDLLSQVDKQMDSVCSCKNCIEM